LTRKPDGFFSALYYYVVSFILFCAYVVEINFKYTCIHAANYYKISMLRY